MKTKVLMVCLGNICRSPLAEGILKSMVDPDHIFVDSAGTGGWHVGNPPDPRSIAVAKKHYIDISVQRCRKFSEKDFDDFDIIYVMDKSNYANVIGMSRTNQDNLKVRLLLEVIEHGPEEVPDPYYDTTDGFEKVYQLIASSCSQIADKLENNSL